MRRRAQWRAARHSRDPADRARRRPGSASPSAVLYPDRDVSAGILTTFVLEAFPAGLKGLMVIGILSAIMSVASICVLTASANYARDIHQRYFKPDISHRGDAEGRHAGIARRRRRWPC